VHVSSVHTLRQRDPTSSLKAPHVTRIAKFLFRFALFLAIVGVGGGGSAWIMAHSGSRLTTLSSGPWTVWPQSGRPDADPYTRAHTVRLGLLPVTSGTALTFHALTDNDGMRLQSTCEYSIESDGIDAAWWSLTLFDDAGNLVRNPSERYAFNSSTAVRESDGGITISLSRDARPGNWLPTTGAGRLTLAWTIQDQKWASQVMDDAVRARMVPGIRKVACR
jgi:hypothetical protein